MVWFGSARPDERTFALPCEYTLSRLVGVTNKISDLLFFFSLFCLAILRLGNAPSRMKVYNKKKDLKKKKKQTNKKHTPPPGPTRQIFWYPYCW